MNLIVTGNNSWLKPHTIAFCKSRDDFMFAGGSTNLPREKTFWLGWYHKVSANELAMCRQNICIHASDLPRGKGHSPATWQLLRGDQIIPLTAFQMTDEIDSGPVLARTHAIIPATALIDEWREILAAEIFKLVEFIVDRQPDPAYFRRRTLKDSEIRLTDDQFNLLRVCDPERYPCYVVRDGQKFKLTIERM